MEILGFVDVPLWLILLLSFLLLLYVYGTWHHSVWVSQGVPGPKPWPLLGNLMEIQEKSHFHVYAGWQQKYGRVVGYFAGVSPILAVTDLDILREIMVKQFSNFTDRAFIRGLRPPLVDKGLVFAEGTSWKRIRTMMTPAFSTSKLKLMSRYVKRCSGLLVSSIENKARSHQFIDVKDVFGSFTLDVIAGTGFGLETNSQTQEDEPFVQHCKAVFSQFSFPGLLRFFFYLASAFPFLGPLMGRFGFGRNAQFFFTALDKMVDQRREEKDRQHQKSVDLLQMLVDAEADPERIADYAENSDDTKSFRRLTKEEIVAQGFIVLVGGYETTATTLQYLTYNLAMHPHVQEKVFEEIREELGDTEPGYENVSKLNYLEAAIRETLRIFPPFAMVSRKARESMTIKGIRIPAGCGVTIPIYCILHDPEYFPDPEVFNPDRFLGENVAKIHPLIMDLPFGYGPRKCIGMRLAMLEIKFAAAQMFRRFRFVKCAETPEKVSLGKSSAMATPDAVIKVKAEIRSA